jgi:capsular polysaccharide transport system permease protein
MNVILRAVTPMRLFLGVVVVPAILYSVYLMAVQTPSYVSEFRVIVRNAQEGSNQALPQLPGIGLPTANAADSYAIIQYLESEAGVVDLNREMQLRKLYSSKNIDLVSRLPGNATIEELTRYWNRMIDAYYENTTNTVVVKTRAYDPQDALRLSKGVLAASERLVNGMTERSRRDMLRYAQRTAEEAAVALRRINARVRILRNQRGVIDPQLVVKANLEQQTQLQAQIAEAEAQLAAAQRYSPASPALLPLRTQIAAMRSTLNGLRARSTGASDRSLSGALNAFEQLQLDQEFAQKRYEQALVTQEKLRAQAAQQQLYLDPIVVPSLPEEADAPRIGRALLIFLGFAVALWAILSLLLKSYRERV